MVEGQKQLYDSTLENHIKRRENNAFSKTIYFNLRKISTHPLLLRNIYTDENCKEIGNLLYRIGFFGNECTIKHVYDEIFKYSDFEIHKICKESYGHCQELKKYIVY